MGSFAQTKSLRVAFLILNDSESPLRLFLEIWWGSPSDGWWALGACCSIKIHERMLLKKCTCHENAEHARVVVLALNHEPCLGQFSLLIGYMKCVEKDRFTQERVTSSGLF